MAKNSRSGLIASIWLLGGLFVLFSLNPAPVQAQAESDSTDTPPVDLLEFLAEQSCQEAEQVFYRQIPRFVYDDQSDQLYELVLYLDSRCDFGEPLGRIQVLASIWDGNFQEIIYNFEVVGWLADRYDESKQGAAGSDRALFDDFTTDFASQMLPHVQPGSLEEFFCLFYTGQTDRAWQLLHDGALENTWLRYYYDEEINTLSRLDKPYVVGAHWGGWLPAGDIDFVGGKHLVGASIEQDIWWGFGRLVLEGRVGRADKPYFVSESGVSGYSDRWNAILIAGEFGLRVWQANSQMVEAFAGVGYDGVQPFKNEETMPAGINLALGVGYRWYPDQSQPWFLRIDGRYEFIGGRNKNGTPLGGSAFSARVGLGVAIGQNPEPRLRLLGQTP